MTRRIGGLTREVRQRAIELEQINQSLEKVVDERTRELRSRNHAFRLILDNAHDGMLTVDLAGVVGAERSMAVERWLGAPLPGIQITDTSGRGVGMGALREVCRELGGDVAIETSQPRGTTIRCTFPREATGGRTLREVVSRSIRDSSAPAPRAVTNAAIATG